MDGNGENILFHSIPVIDFCDSESHSLAIGINTSQLPGKSVAEYFGRKLALQVEKYLGIKLYRSEWAAASLSRNRPDVWHIENSENILNHLRKKIQSSGSKSLVLIPLFMHCGTFSDDYQDGYSRMFCECQCRKDSAFAIRFMQQLLDEITQCKGTVLVLLETCLPLITVESMIKSSSTNILAVCGSGGNEIIPINKGLTGFVLKQSLKYLGNSRRLDVAGLRNEIQNVRSALQQLKRSEFVTTTSIWNELNLGTYVPCLTSKRGENAFIFDTELWESLKEEIEIQYSRENLEVFVNKIKGTLHDPLKLLSDKVSYLNDGLFRLTILSMASQICCVTLHSMGISISKALQETFTLLWETGLTVDKQFPPHFADFCVFLVNVIHQMRVMKLDDSKVCKVVHLCQYLRSTTIVSANDGSDSPDGFLGLKPPNLDYATPPAPHTPELTPELLMRLQAL